MYWKDIGGAESQERRLRSATTIKKGARVLSHLAAVVKSKEKVKELS